MKTFIADTEFGQFTVQSNKELKTFCLYLYQTPDGLIPSIFKYHSVSTVSRYHNGIYYSRSKNQKYLSRLIRNKTTDTGFAYNANQVKLYDLTEVKQ